YHQRIARKQGLELPASARRRLNLEGGPEQLAQLALAFRNRHARLHREIDPIERQSTPEHLLRRVDIHDREIAAEGARQTSRLHESPDRERLVSFNGPKRQVAANSDTVSRGEVVGKDQRIGLGEEDQRIVDLCLLTLFEVVIAQAAIA